jgi:site-specific recombinase XerD
MNMQKVEDWLGTIPSNSTRKNYINGVKKFERFLKAEIESVLDKDDTELGHLIEKFHVWEREQNIPQNSIRCTVNGVLQYFKYFGKNPRYRKALGIFRTTMSTKDRKITIAEVQELGKVADLREQILLETFLLGLRISDACVLEWKQFEQDEFLLNTKKEQVR